MSQKVGQTVRRFRSSLPSLLEGCQYGWRRGGEQSRLLVILIRQLGGHIHMVDLRGP